MRCMSECSLKEKLDLKKNNHPMLKKKPSIHETYFKIIKTPNKSKINQQSKNFNKMNTSYTQSASPERRNNMENLVRRQQSIQQLFQKEPLHTDATPKMQGFRKFDLKQISQNLKIQTKIPLKIKEKKNQRAHKRTVVASTPYNFGMSKGFPSFQSRPKALFPTAATKPNCLTGKVSPLHDSMFLETNPNHRRKNQTLTNGTFLTQSVYTENPRAEHRPAPVLVNLDKVPETKESKMLGEMQGISNRYSKYSRENFIPCLFLKANAQKVLLYFHANGEDLAQVLPIVKQLNIIFNVNIIAVEYPGYGIYPNPKNIEGKKAKVIIEDALCVYKFITETLNIKQEDIILAGRSIGSGPACHLASVYTPLCLVLISPIKSVNDTARKICGPIAHLLIEERFNNI